MAGCSWMAERGAHIDQRVQEEVLVELLEAGHPSLALRWPADLGGRRGRRACSGGKQQGKVAADSRCELLACITWTLMTRMTTT